MIVIEVFVIGVKCVCYRSDEFADGLVHRLLGGIGRENPRELKGPGHIVAVKDGDLVFLVKTNGKGLVRFRGKKRAAAAIPERSNGRG
jgi:hypothetical protein